MKILIFGGTGFVGEGITDFLVRQGHKVTLVVREETKSNENAENLNYVQGDLSKFELLKDKLDPKDFDAVIYSVGLIREKGNLKFIDFHYNWLKQVIDFFKGTPTKFVLISANGVKKNGTGYQHTKWLGEEYLKASKLSYTILRPSIIFGNSNQYNFIQVIRGLIKFSLVPIFGRGNYKLAPVYREDLAQVINLAATGKLENEIRTVCGPEVFEYKDLIKLIAKIDGKKSFLCIFQF